MGCGKPKPRPRPRPRPKNKIVLDPPKGKGYWSTVEDDKQRITIEWVEHA